MTPGTYQSIFQKPPSSSEALAATRSAPAMSLIGPVKIFLPAMMASRSAITLSTTSFGTGALQQAMSVPPSLMPGKAPYGFGSQLPAATFFSWRDRKLCHVQTHEHSGALGANSREAGVGPRAVARP